MGGLVGGARRRNGGRGRPESTGYHDADVDVNDVGATAAALFKKQRE